MYMYLATVSSKLISFTIFLQVPGGWGQQDQTVCACRTKTKLETSCWCHLNKVTHPSLCRSPNKQSKKSNAAVVVVVVILIVAVIPSKPRIVRTIFYSWMSPEI